MRTLDVSSNLTKVARFNIPVSHMCQLAAGYRLIRFVNIVFTSLTYFGLTCDLLTPKGDRFNSSPRKPLVSICCKIDSSVFNIYLVDKIIGDGNEPTTERTDGSRTLCLLAHWRRLRGTAGDPPPENLRWRGRMCLYPIYICLYIIFAPSKNN